MSGRDARRNRVVQHDLERDIVRAGVVWHRCQHCGKPWPFPVGAGSEREWVCHCCVQAQWAKLQRALAALEPVARRVAEHVEAKNGADVQADSGVVPA